VRLRENASGGAITARVISSTFFGATQRLVAEVTPEHRLQLDLPSTLAFRPGDTVAFDIDRQALIEFPHAEQAPC